MWNWIVVLVCVVFFVEIVNRDVLVTRRALNMQPKVEDDEEQRGHIFHTKDVI